MAHLEISWDGKYDVWNNYIENTARIIYVMTITEHQQKGRGDHDWGAENSEEFWFWTLCLILIISKVGRHSVSGSVMVTV